MSDNNHAPDEQIHPLTHFTECLIEKVTLTQSSYSQYPPKQDFKWVLRFDDGRLPAHINRKTFQTKLHLHPKKKLIYDLGQFLVRRQIIEIPEEFRNKTVNGYVMMLEKLIPALPGLCDVWNKDEGKFEWGPLHNHRIAVLITEKVEWPPSPKYPDNWCLTVNRPDPKESRDLTYTIFEIGRLTNEVSGQIQIDKERVYEQPPEPTPEEPDDVPF